MRILILSPTLPYPPASGFAIRVYQFLRLLARAHTVTLLAYVTPEETDGVAALEALGVGVHTVIRAPATSEKRWAQLRSVLSLESFQRRNAWSDEMQQKLEALSRRDRYDVIQVETSQLVCFDFDPRAVLVVDEHDIVYELLHRMSQTDPSIVRRFYNWTEYKKFRRDEIRTWRRAAGCVTTSAREERIIRPLAPNTPILVAPNGVDVDYFQPSHADVDAGAIVMTGFMKTRPNIDAALFFVKHTLPRIVAARANAVFYIVGGGPPDEIKRLASPNVVVTDAVPDVRPFVHKAAVFVVPMRIGGGTRLKVLEGLAMQKPMVSTSLGCEGIEVRHAEHLLIADEPAAFADAVIRLLDDRALGDKLARAGRALVERRYQWASIVAEVEQFYERLVHR
jgi:glycosyltransferase involved in cell wall biosynthesis